MKILQRTIARGATALLLVMTTAVTVSCSLTRLGRHTGGVVGAEIVAHGLDFLAGAGGGRLAGRAGRGRSFQFGLHGASHTLGRGG